MDSKALQRISEEMAQRLIGDVKAHQGDIGDCMSVAGELAVSMAQLGKISVGDFTNDLEPFSQAAGETFDHLLKLAKKYHIPPFDFMIILANMIKTLAERFQELGITNFPDQPVN